MDARAAARAFPHYWEQVFGSGRAILSLRESYRSDLRAMKSATGIHYVRFHAIFDDEVGVYSEDAQGQPVYNWSYVDQIYDGLLENGVRPFVEMSFMPRPWLRRCPPRVLVPSAAVAPKDYAKWEELVFNFARHLVDRYGARKCRNGISRFGTSRTSTSGPANRSRPPTSSYTIMRPGPSSAPNRVCEWGPRHRASRLDSGDDRHSVHSRFRSISCPLMFMATIYRKTSLGPMRHIDRSEMVCRAVQKVYQQVKASARPDLPIIWSEYNASYKNESMSPIRLSWGRGSQTIFGCVTALRPPCPTGLFPMSSKSKG